MIGGGHLLLPEILGQSDRVEAKSPILDLLALGSPKGGVAPKCKTVAYGLKSHFDRRTSAIKFLCVKTVSDKVVGH